MKIAKVILSALIITGMAYVSGVMIYTYLSQKCPNIAGVGQFYAICESDMPLLGTALKIILLLFIPLVMLWIIDKKK